MKENRPMIEIENLHYSIGKRTILEDLSLEIQSHERVGLIGFNGAGKTTLCHLIMGILKPTSGRIRIDGTDVSELPLYEVGRRIGFLFQNPAQQIFSPSLEEELGFAMKYRGVEKEIIDASVNQMIERLSLETAVETPSYYLSQGEKQRLAIGSLLLNDPKFLILDEPTTGLDKQRKEDLGRILSDLQDSHIGMLLISHDHAFVRKHTDRVLKIEKGGVIYDWDR